MGQAKQRGSFEERKVKAVERERHERIVRTQLDQRRPSPKHSVLMAYLMGLSK